MKVLILSCNTGEGHNSCAKAIQEVYQSRNRECDILDALNLVGPRLSRFVSWSHVYMYRHLPWLFGPGYNLSDKYAAARGEKAMLYKLFYKGAEDLQIMIRDNGYTCVICTHPFSALMLTEAQRRYHLPIQTAFVATDYTCSPTVKDSNLDYYVIPHADLTDDFLCSNIPKEKIIPCGIPIRQMFYTKATKSEAKGCLGLPKKCCHTVVMCGSMGCGPIQKLAKALTRQLPKNARITIICGTNQKLQKRLERRFSKDDRVNVRGYVQDVGLLLSSADLYVTKPGGISVTEAAAKNVPMVLMDTVGGCEQYNGEFYTQRGCAVMSKDTKVLIETCKALQTDQVRYDRMAEKLLPMQKQNAALCIYKVLGDKEQVKC